MTVTRTFLQLTGQLIWCVAHTAWIGSSFMVWTSLALCAHHVLGAAHGDFRLHRQYGSAFDEVRCAIIASLQRSFDANSCGKAGLALSHVATAFHVGCKNAGERGDEHSAIRGDHHWTTDNPERLLAGSGRVCHTLPLWHSPSARTLHTHCYNAPRMR